jgi:hypothetical protein
MTEGTYILDGHEPVLEPDTHKWGSWFETADRVVKTTSIKGRPGRVSTVFLGLDHKYGDGAPLLFETMIFGGKHNEYQARCSTWDEAIEQHHEACKLIRG